MKRFLLLAAWSLLVSTRVQAQQAMSMATVVVVPAYGEVKAANDEVHATFFIEEQDKDKAQAASRVNQKMRQGMDILKKEDSQAVLATRGYYTYPAYADEQQPSGVPRKRQQTGWRVGQYLELKTVNLPKLPSTVAAVQRVLSLNGLTFGLSDASSKRLDAARIEAAYKNLMERVQVIAKAMGRSQSDAIVELIDFDGGGNLPQVYASAPMMMKSAVPDTQVAEPSFEPGESTLSMRVVGKVKFK